MVHILDVASGFVGTASPILGTDLPYADISELPASVREQYDDEALAAFRQAFNNAWETYSDLENGEREQRAFKVAHASVQAAEQPTIDRVPPEKVQTKVRELTDQSLANVDADERRLLYATASGQPLSWQTIQEIADSRHGGPADAWARDRLAQRADILPDAAIDRIESAPRAKGAATRYVHAYAFGEVDHSFDKTRQVGDEFVALLSEGMRRLREAGYYPPILQQHQPDEEGERSEGDGKDPRPVEDGFSHGRIVDVVSSRMSRASDIDVPTPDRPGVWIGIDPTEDVEQAIDNGKIRHWSPGYYEHWQPAEQRLGEFPLAPRHLAFVSIPQQKTLAPTDDAYRLSEVGRADEVFCLAEQSTFYTQGADMADDNEQSETSTDAQEDVEMEDDTKMADDAEMQDGEYADYSDRELLVKICKSLKKMVGDDADDPEEMAGTSKSDDEMAGESLEMSETQVELAEKEQRIAELEEDAIRRELCAAGYSDEAISEAIDSGMPVGAAKAIASDGGSDPQPQQQRSRTTKQTEMSEKSDEEILDELEEDGYDPTSTEFYQEAEKRGVSFQ